MQLALCNAQGELHPLERGMHALGFVEGGGKVRAYADALGQRSAEDNISLMLKAAKVVRHVSDDEHGAALFRMRDNWCALSELHSAPRWLWRALVGLALL